MLLKKTSSQQQCIIMMKHSVGCPGGCTVSGTRSVPWPATVQTVRLRPCFTGTARSGTKLKTSATRLAPHICRIAAVSSLAAVSTSTSSTHSSSHVLQHTYCSQAARSRQRIRCRAGNSNGGGSASAEAVVDQEQAEVIEPFSEDDLQALSELENYIDVDVVGEAWRSQFADDVDGLYDYVDRCAAVTQQQYPTVLHPRYQYLPRVKSKSCVYICGGRGKQHLTDYFWYFTKTVVLSQ